MRMMRCRRMPLALLLLLAATTLAAPRAAQAGPPAPQLVNPDATWYSSDYVADNWAAPDGGSVSRYLSVYTSWPASIALSRSAGSYVSSAASCAVHGSYWLPGARYRLTFQKRTTSATSAAMIWIGTPNGFLVNGQGISGPPDQWHQESADFTMDATNYVCFTAHADGAYGSGTDTTLFLDDLSYSVLSYPAPSAITAAGVAETGLGARQGGGIRHVPAVWNIRAPYPVTRSLEWRRCDPLGQACTLIGSGSIGATYVPTADDVGHTIVVRETATNDEAVSRISESAPSPVIAPAPPALAAGPEALPRISGTPREGERLTVNSGTWTGTQPLRAAYRWLRCDWAGSDCRPLAGATDAGYTLTPSDVGFRLAAVVTMTNGGGSIDAPAVLSDPIVGLPPVPSGNAVAPAGDEVDAPVPPVSFPGSGASSNSSVAAVLVARRVTAGGAVTVRGRLRRTPAGPGVVEIALVNRQWSRFTRRYRVRTRRDGSFSIGVRPQVSSEVWLRDAAAPGGAIRIGTVAVLPRIVVTVTATRNADGSARNLVVRGAFLPKGGPAVTLQWQAKPRGNRSWYALCSSREQVRVGKTGKVLGRCRLNRLYADNLYRLAYVSGPGSPYASAVSTARRARLHR